MYSNVIYYVNVCVLDLIFIRTLKVQITPRSIKYTIIQRIALKSITLNTYFQSGPRWKQTIHGNKQITCVHNAYLSVCICLCTTGLLQVLC